jgi:hypothetical protein
VVVFAMARGVKLPVKRGKMAPADEEDVVHGLQESDVQHWRENTAQPAQGVSVKRSTGLFFSTGLFSTGLIFVETAKTNADLRRTQTEEMTGNYTRFQ